MNTIQEVPIGLSKKIITEKFGENSKSIDDLVFQKISYKKTISYLRKKKNTEKMIERINHHIKKIEKEIREKKAYLSKWYDSYFRLASQCQECILNHNNEYCSFFGKNKMPKVNENFNGCIHFIDKSFQHVNSEN